MSVHVWNKLLGRVVKFAPDTMSINRPLVYELIIYENIKLRNIDSFSNNQ